MACRAAMRLFIPNETKEKMAQENARLLMQAQTDIGTLSNQMAAGAEGTKKQVEWYEGQTPTTPATPTAQATPMQDGWGQQSQGSTTYPIQPLSGWGQQVQGSTMSPTESSAPRWNQQGQGGNKHVGKTEDDRAECIIT